MSLLTNFDTDVSFWKTYPQFKVLDPFKELYKDDKSRDKANSSQKMWAIAFLCDPSKSNPYRNLSRKDKQHLIARDFLKQENFDWFTLKEVIAFYDKCLLTQEQKSLLAWKNKMEERDFFLANTPYTLENGKDLDTMLAKTKELYLHLKSLEDKVEQAEAGEEKETKIKSLLDTL
jgi:hypothetical protein